MLMRAHDRDELIDIVANDRIGVAIVRHHLERDGEKLSYVLAQVYRIDNGKLVEYWEYPEPGLLPRVAMRSTQICWAALRFAGSADSDSGYLTNRYDPTGEVSGPPT
ncbi:hypothetical protein A5780_24290 [Nocardia sp. 852002-20019_SCH5090214]|nr:hypothetical protein A5780_24290 [Nocardia sp. 852002-20019_SCH5090214]